MCAALASWDAVSPSVGRCGRSGELRPRPALHPDPTQIHSDPHSLAPRSRGPDLRPAAGAGCLGATKRGRRRQDWASVPTTNGSFQVEIGGVGVSTHVPRENAGLERSHLGGSRGWAERQRAGSRGLQGGELFAQAPPTAPKLPQSGVRGCPRPSGPSPRCPWPRLPCFSRLATWASRLHLRAPHILSS